jgi:hypothetical protein
MDETKLYIKLKNWRLKQSKKERVALFIIFHNSVLSEISEKQPKTIMKYTPGLS